MQTRPLGRTNLQASILGFGAAPIGFLKTDIERVGQILNLLLDNGVNLIDTAAAYPGSEEAIAQTVGHRRAQFILVSKCGTTFPDIPGEAWSRDVIGRTIDRSLKRLKTDHLDVMLLHSCDLATLQNGEAIAALVEARSAGKIRHAGYSGDNQAVAWAAAHPEIAVIETSISIADQINIDLALPVARQRNAGVLAKRPIANAAWKDPKDQPGMYADYARPYRDRLSKMNLHPADLGFPDDSNESWSELALRFTLSFPAVTTAIIGTTNPQNARANIQAAAKGPLPPQVLQKIRDAFRRADPAGTWTGQT